jgi:hypothetical protein
MNTMDPERMGRTEMVKAAWERASRDANVELEKPALDYVLEKPALDYVLAEVLPADDEWTNVWRRAQPRRVESILQESFQRAAELSRDRGRGSVDRTTAEQAFHEIVEAKYHCPYPFLIC